MLQILFSLIAGILTVGAPCILPLLPILLGASVGQKSRSRPLFIAFGFIIMFSLAGLTLSFIVSSLMISPDILRNIAITALGIFGIFLIFPKFFESLTQSLSGYITKAQNLSQKAGSGNFGGFVLGLILGLIWTPCAGPILGSILTLIATQAELAQAIPLLIAYAIGAGIPMLAIAYGGQFVTTKVRVLSTYASAIQKIFGAIILLLAVAMYFQYDLKFQSKLLEYYNFPSLEEKLFHPETEETATGSESLKNSALPDLGIAPNFIGINQWLNSDPLTMSELRGKVVLIDFWTYSCINCIRTLPYVTSWYETYKDKGFVVIGVHTPEFAFEKVPENVQTAMKRYGITYPVAQDNDFATWKAYENHYWPAHYLIDREGKIRYTHFGEGKYEETENAIRQLLDLGDMEMAKTEPSQGNVRTPEIYFGSERLEYLTRSQQPSSTGTKYSFPENLEKNHFALEGEWLFSPEKIALINGPGKIKMKFSAAKIHMVAEAKNLIPIQISVDGKALGEVKIGFSNLYTLFDSTDYGEHEIIIDIPEAGLEAFTFTFG